MIGYETVLQFFRRYDIHVGPVKVDVCEKWDKYLVTIKDLNQQKPTTAKAKQALKKQVNAVQLLRNRSCYHSY